MNEQIRRGYARLLRDIQRSDHPTQLQLALERAKASIDEFERIITRLEKLDQMSADDSHDSNRSDSVRREKHHNRHPHRGTKGVKGK